MDTLYVSHATCGCLTGSRRFYSAAAMLQAGLPFLAPPLSYDTRRLHRRRTLGRGMRSRIRSLPRCFLVDLLLFSFFHLHSSVSFVMAALSP